MRRAFTVVELLTVIGIVGLISAILFPVIGAAKMRGRHAETVSNLHQLGLAIALYRQDAEGGGRDEGTAEEMGLPVPYGALLERLPFGISRCTSGRLSDDPQFVALNLMYLSPVPVAWNEVIAKHYDRSILIAGMCFGDPNVPVTSAFFDHHGIGLALAGNVRVVQRRGDWQKQGWWQP